MASQGGTYVRTDGRTYGISPHSTGLRLLSGPLSKKAKWFFNQNWSAIGLVDLNLAYQPSLWAAAPIGDEVL